jgi:biopolymer transport protein ExbD
MKTTLRLMMVLMLAFAVTVACSQNNGNGEQAKPSAQKETAPAAQPQTDKAVAGQKQAPAAQEQMSTPSASQQMNKAMEQKPSSQVTPSGQMAAKVREVSGTLVKTNEGIRLFSDSGNYMLAGRDLSDMVGQNVKVTGTIEENAGKQIITVASVSVIK